jgi:hypothetical protein
MVITVGSGAGAAFRPWLRLATGSAILAEQVAAGDGFDLAFVNPSALLTQAYRGVGLFRGRFRCASSPSLSELGSVRLHGPPANGKSRTSRRNDIRCACRFARISPPRRWC